MWVLFLLVLSIGNGEASCPSQGGDVPEGHVSTFGCLSCTCRADSLYSCTYPRCNWTHSAYPCLRYDDVCCGECVEHGCFNQFSRGSIVPRGPVAVPDPCMECTCRPGFRLLICSSVMCQRPTCPNFRRKPGSCCDFVCPDEDQVK